MPGFETASYARGINNSGDIVGESDSADRKRAFLFTKGPGIGDRIGTDTGFGLTTAGTGTPTSVLAGQPTTMAVGPTLVGLDGAGFPEINGPRPGSLGGKVTNT